MALGDENRYAVEVRISMEASNWIILIVDVLFTVVGSEEHLPAKAE